MRNKNEFYRDKEFSSDDKHVQRCTIPAWRDALLHNQDQVIISGNVRKLIGKDIGFGVVEVSVAPLTADQAAEVLARLTSLDK
jgi:hypothetical protein